MKKPGWANLVDFRKSLENLHPSNQKVIWARTIKRQQARPMTEAEKRYRGIID